MVKKWLCGMRGDAQALDNYRSCCEKFDQYLNNSLPFNDTELEVKLEIDDSKKHFKVYHKQKLVHEFSLIRVDNNYRETLYIDFYIEESKVVNSVECE